MISQTESTVATKKKRIALFGLERPKFDQNQIKIRIRDLSDISTKINTDRQLIFTIRKLIQDLRVTAGEETISSK